MHKIAKAIKRGNLEQLRQFLAEDPEALNRTFNTLALSQTGLLHIAAYYNQPEIVKFLVEKGLDINQKYYAQTPLHYAAGNDGYQAIGALLSLGADASLTRADGKAAYEVCANKGTANVLLNSYNECLRHKEQKKEEPRVRTGHVEYAIANPEGTWKQGTSDSEIVFERDLPGQKLRLTETFNFAADLRILIVQNLETGCLSQPETKLLSEVPKMAGQARAEMEKLQAAKNQPKLIRK